MATWFDEARLDDAGVLETVDLRLRTLAESGARVRREAHEAATATAELIARGRDEARPRAVIAAGPDSRLLRAVLEPWCPVPFVAWPNPGLPGWAGSPRPRRDARARGQRPRVGVRRRRGRTPWLPGRRRLPRALARRRARRRTSRDGAADGDRRPAGHGRGDARLPRPRAPRPARRRRVGGRVPRRGRHRLLAAPRPRRQPGQDARDRDGRHQPAGVGRLGPRRPRRPAAGRVACGARADAPPSPATPSTCCRSSRRPGRTTSSPTRSPRSRPTCGRCCWSSTTAPTTPSYASRRRCLRAAAARHGVRVETLDTDADAEVARYASLLLAGTYAAEYLRVGLVED